MRLTIAQAEPPQQNYRYELLMNAINHIISVQYCMISCTHEVLDVLTISFASSRTITVLDCVKRRSMQHSKMTRFNTSSIFFLALAILSVVLANNGSVRKSREHGGADERTPEDAAGVAIEMSTTNVQDETHERFLGLADYGNWCGAGNTRSDENYPCKDGTDCACRAHDLCIRNRGKKWNLHYCGCDYHFIKDLTRSSCSNSHCEAYRVAAISSFQHKPCVCKKRVCVWRACRNVYYGGIGGKPNC